MNLYLYFKGKLAVLRTSVHHYKNVLKGFSVGYISASVVRLIKSLDQHNEEKRTAMEEGRLLVTPMRITQSDLQSVTFQAYYGIVATLFALDSYPH